MSQLKILLLVSGHRDPVIDSIVTYHTLKEKSGFFMDINDRSLQISIQTTPNNNFLKIYYQNIRSLRKKLHELIGHLHPILPHVICLNEHHLNILEKAYVNIEGYTIGAQFCRVTYEKGGVIIYVHNSLQYTNIDLSEYCKENDIEICALNLIIKALKIFIITIYRTPSGNFNYCYTS
jgi:hypothetical protein